MVAGEASVGAGGAERRQGRRMQGMAAIYGGLDGPEFFTP
ncbi:hypothetical protein TREPR_2267 [Treponema primitia ZAS-2]|uniref:Uncharacterized protein n=1 Tax=Treponema primitia (strain ATCC BAA-887 / DSM 12427 / ZAS-2) TaxID=545694 RepID=F5YIE0_TREPZ|nr:hypothetical protein TREPR_2267 [Treponema primitia ZAS-2]